MKRLLAADSGPIYVLAKAFRAGDRGRHHNPEFTLLEWYRPGWDESQLMEELADLVGSVGCASSAGALRVTYRDIFLATVNIDPHQVSLAKLSELASDIAQRDMSSESRATCLDLIFSFEIEARLPPGIVFVYDYPECLCALAQLGVDDQGVTVARRFEVFLDRTELANGYFELLDGAEQRRRFSEDNRQRKAMGKTEMSADEKLLAALDAGLPSCAGVALGIDRLLMHLVGAQHIDEVIAFPH
jgi:lysyl-tRNA synthetase class 2